jgi:hypothetical protein
MTDFMRDRTIVPTAAKLMHEDFVGNCESRGAHAELVIGYRRDNKFLAA